MCNGQQKLNLSYLLIWKGIRSMMVILYLSWLLPSLVWHCWLVLPYPDCARKEAIKWLSVYVLKNVQKKMGTLSTVGQKSATELLPVIMAALRSRCGHYIFALWFLSSIFFYSSPNLSGRRLDVYHTIQYNTNKNLYSAKFVDKTRQRRWVVS